jgi:hypothetical protein
MPLLDTDQALTRRSYYAATAAGQPRLRRCRARPAATWPWSAAAWPGCRRRSTCAGAGSTWCCWKRASARLRRQRPQRRPGHPRPGLRPGPSRRSWAWTRPGASGTCRSRRWTCCASASPSTASTATGSDGYLGLATSAGKGRALAAWADRWSSVYGYPLQRIAPADIGRWIASPRYHSGVHDPRSGHLHPLKYTLAWRARRGGRACGCTRAQPGRKGAGARRRAAAAHPRRGRCARARCCWPATSTCTAWRRRWRRASCRWAPTLPAAEPCPTRCRRA